MADWKRVSPLHWLAVSAALLLAAFFAFVGYHKIFDSLADLTRYGAWTIWLPEPLGRLVGWSELGCALALALGAFLPRWRRAQRFAAWILVANQLAAAAFHLLHGEVAALPQNGLLIALSLLVALAGTSSPDFVKAKGEIA